MQTNFTFKGTKILTQKLVPIQDLHKALNEPTSEKLVTLVHWRFHPHLTTPQQIQMAQGHIFIRSSLLGSK